MFEELNINQKQRVTIACFNTYKNFNLRGPVSEKMAASPTS